MSANQLHLNADKTKVMLICKSAATKKDFSIQMAGKTIKHSSQVKILGNTMMDNLTWDRHVTRDVIRPEKSRENSENSIQVS